VEGLVVELYFVGVDDVVVVVVEVELVFGV
jgi:hypothetical protein